MIGIEKQSLPQIFNEPNYAWQLLEWQIAIQMDEQLSGQAIAKLLELYMRGVEKMNSLMDVRESYFKNKVTTLMMKSTVVKTLNKPPMAKKQKPLEVNSKPQPKESSKTNGESKNSKKKEKNSLASTSVQFASPLVLKEKRKEMEMRLAYEADASSRETLNIIYDQHVKKQENYHSKVNGLISDHESRLKERIMKRKLRTATYRSRPEDTSDTFLVEDNKIKNQHEGTFSPRGSKQTDEKESNKKRSRSLVCTSQHDLKLDSSPRRPRKKTQDLTQEKDKEMEIERRLKQIESFQDFKNKIEELKKAKEEEIVLDLIIKQQEPGEGQGEIENEYERMIANRQSI